MDKEAAPNDTDRSSNKQAFSEYVDSEMERLGISEADISDRFAVPRSVVRRWRAGDVRAHRVVREVVVEFLENYSGSQKVRVSHPELGSELMELTQAEIERAIQNGCTVELIAHSEQAHHQSADSV